MPNKGAWEEEYATINGDTTIVTGAWKWSNDKLFISGKQEISRIHGSLPTTSPGKEKKYRAYRRRR